MYTIQISGKRYEFYERPNFSGENVVQMLFNLKIVTICSKKNCLELNNFEETLKNGWLSATVRNRVNSIVY